MSFSHSYWFDPATYHEDSERRQMSSFTKPDNGWSIRVTFEKRKKQWITQKFKGKELVRSAFGSTFDQAMIQTTIDGLELNEHTKSA